MTDAADGPGTLAGSLFAALPGAGPDESVTALLDRPGVRIRRIVSHGHATPEGQWYDQDDDEWVAVLFGAARIRIDGEADAREMSSGDWLFLPARCRHRVEWTSGEGPTCWLAVHMDAPSAP